MGCQQPLTITASVRMPTTHGEFLMESFRVDASPLPHLAMSAGLDTGDLPLVRVHSECATSEVFGSLRCDCRQQLEDSMRRIQEAGCGVLVYLRQEGRGIGIENKLKAYVLQDGGLDTVDANLALNLPVDARSFSPAAAYLRHRGVHRCVLLTNNDDKLQCLRDHGIDATRSPLRSAAHAESHAYLETKRVRLGHYL